MKTRHLTTLLIFAALITSVAGDIIIESRQGGKNSSWYTEVKGNWMDSEAKSLARGCSPESLGSRFVIIEGNFTPAEATFTPFIQEAGMYDVYVTWGRSGNATNVKYNIFNGSESKTIYLDQDGWGAKGTPNSGIWVHLGTYNLPAGNRSYVSVLSDSVTGQPQQTDSGRVYTDAAMFSLRVKGASGGSPQNPGFPAPSSESQTRSPFGTSPAASSASSPSPFGKPSAPAPSSPFGASASTTSSSPFGASPQPRTQPGSPFGTSPAASSPFLAKPQAPSTSSQAVSQTGSPFSGNPPSAPAPTIPVSTPSSFPSQGGFTSRAQPPATNVASSGPPVSLRWYTSYSQAVKAGIAQRKKIILFFRFDNDPNSQNLERLVLNAHGVKATLVKNYICGKIDIPENRKVCEYYGVFQGPTFILLDERGYSIGKMDNIRDATQFLQELSRYR